MPRKKQKKINEADSLPNVLVGKPDDKKKWLQDYFGNEKTIILEIGCGRGDYVINLAQKSPQINYIGVDVKGARLWTAAKTAIVLKIENVAFLRARAEELDEYFDANSIDEIWITFPDPFPKKRTIKNRVTSPGFLNVYKKVLKEN